MLKRTKTYQRAALRYQKILAFIEEKLGLHKQFEDTVDRWERKGLVRPVNLSTKVERFRKEDIAHLPREMWDDVVEETRREPRDYRSEAASRSDTGQLPDRRRLRRLYRWQLRHQPKGLRETYDELVTSLRS
jgi:hypothetical protein